MRLVKCEVWEKDAFFGVQVVFLFRGWRLEWGRKKKGFKAPAAMGRDSEILSAFM